MNLKSLFLALFASAVCAYPAMTGMNTTYSTGSPSLGDPTILYVIAIGLLGAGLLFTLFGLKMFKAIIFITGFVPTFGVTFFIAVGTKTDGASYLIGFLLGAVFGVAGGYLALCCHKFAIFLIGFAGGFVALSFLFASLMSNSSGNGGIIILMGLLGGVVCGILAIKIHDAMIIIQTSIMGSAMIVASILFFVHGWGFMTGFERSNGMWILVGIFISAVGIFFQCKGKSGDYKGEQSLSFSQDPLVINVNAGPQIAFQQPVVQQPYGFQNNGYPAANPGYPPQNGYQNVQPQGQGYPSLPQVNNSGSQDYQRVQN